ncbi:hypothetical protein AGMMS50256_36740 [Betaproteobacteria bacterium]|nr:hypothetical protein AGMMS50256_36740 [Betaproteobacteria bacterium]
MTGDLEQERQKNNEGKYCLFLGYMEYLTMFSILEIFRGNDKLGNELTNL